MEEQYEPSWLARFFHQYPHVDWSFSKISNRFTPEEEEYCQNLVVWAAVPVALLLLLLLTLFIYYCYSCCASQPARCRSFSRFQWVIAILTFISWVCIATGMVGNQEVQRGWSSMNQATQDVSELVQQMNVDLRQMKQLLEGSLEGNVTSLKQFGRRNVNADKKRAAFDEWRRKVSSQSKSAQQAIQRIEEKLPSGAVDTGSADTVMLWRFIASWCVYGYMLLASMLLLIGICRRCKRILIVASVFGILGLIIIWCFVGAHHGVAIAGGDLCVEPENYIRHNTRGFNMSTETFDYYTSCDGDLFEKDVLDSFVAITKVNNTAHKLESLLNVSSTAKQELVRLEAGVSHASMRSLEQLLLVSRAVSCPQLHSSYMRSLHAVCYTALEGLALQLLVSILMGFCFFAVLLTVAISLRHYRKRGSCNQLGSASSESQVVLTSAGRVYNNEEESDPFLPRQQENGFRGTNDPYAVQAETIPLNSPQDENLHGSPPPEYRQSHGYPRAPTAPSDF